MNKRALILQHTTEERGGLFEEVLLEITQPMLETWLASWGKTLKRPTPNRTRPRIFSGTPLFIWSVFSPRPGGFYGDTSSSWKQKDTPSIRFLHPLF